jgi:ferrous-iron efflux pump FieF
MDAKAHDRKARLMRQATLFSVGVAGIMVSVKLAAWILTGSVALLSTLVDSTLDGVASLINFLAIRHALQPADRDHRFGHAKAEPLAGLAQSAFIIGSALFLMGEAAQRLFEPAPVTDALFGIGVMVVAIIVTLALVLFQSFVVKRTGSLAISADHLHYVGDLAMNGAVIVSLLLSSQAGFTLADPIFAFGIALYLIWGAWKIGVRSYDLLMDKEFPDDQRQRIEGICLSEPGIHGVHDLRTRSAGLAEFIQIHVTMDPDITLRQAHILSDRVEAALMKAFPAADVIIHQDPHGVPEPERLPE